MTRVIGEHTQMDRPLLSSKAPPPIWWLAVAQRQAESSGNAISLSFLSACTRRRRLPLQDVGYGVLTTASTTGASNR
jgi:hypothetical protein